MREFYDEVERIGDRVGTYRMNDGMYSVATNLTSSKQKKTVEVKEQEVLKVLPPKQPAIQQKKQPAPFIPVI